MNADRPEQKQTQQANQQQSGMFAAASQAIDASMEKVEKLVTLVNNIPTIIRTNVLFTSKLVSANIQNLGNVIAGAATTKEAPVTKDNYAIITFLESKHPKIYEALQKYASESGDVPLEKRTYQLLKLSHEHIKPILTQESQ